MSSTTLSRRRFLRRTGGALAAAVALPNFVPASALGRNGVVAPSERITMGFIGLGGQGSGHLFGGAWTYGAARELFAIAVWHAHDTAKIYRDVIVQVADDEDFTETVRTLFNNDADNSSGLGVGTNRQYFETFQGKLVAAKGVRARYVRLYSHGSTDSPMNEYTEVEIYGR